MDNDNGDSHFIDNLNHVNDENSSLNLSDNDSVDYEGALSENSEPNVDVNEKAITLKYAIVRCIFQAIELNKESGESLSNFEALLSFARQMYCLGKEIDEDDPNVKKMWPKTWEEARKYLVKLGYNDAKEYFICLNKSHHMHWDIMESQTDVCRRTVKILDLSSIITLG